MLDRGVYLAPSGYEAIFPSLAHADADLDHTLAAVGEAASALGGATAGR
jgi:glutamate-1-semialdehyde 2,1-aminomutase